MSVKKQPHTHAAARVIKQPTSKLNDREEEALTHLFQAFGLATANEDLDHVPNVVVTIMDKWSQSPDRIHNLQSLFKQGIIRNLRVLRDEDGLGFQIAFELLTQLEDRLQTKPKLSRFADFIGLIKPVTDRQVQPSEQATNA